MPMSCSGSFCELTDCWDVLSGCFAIASELYVVTRIGQESVIRSGQAGLRTVPGARWRRPVSDVRRASRIGYRRSASGTGNRFFSFV
jgi:hypothetical protein